MLNRGVSVSEATDLRVPFESQPTGNSADVGANAHFYFLGNFAETGAVVVPPFPRIAAPTNLTQSRQQAKAVQGGVARNSLKKMRKMARPTGFEPVTPAFGVRYFNRK